MEDQSKVDIRFSIQPRSSSLLSGHVSVGTTCCTSVVPGFSSANNVVVVVVVGIEGETVVSGVGVGVGAGAIEEGGGGESEYDDIFFIFLFLMYTLFILTQLSQSLSLESPQIFYFLF